MNTRIANTTRWICCAVALVAIGCRVPMVGPDFEEPQAVVAREWIEAGAGPLRSSPIDEAEWWRVFKDPVLDALVLRAQQQNLTLQVAGVRVFEARAQLGIAGGDLYPQLQLLTADYNYNYRPDVGGGKDGSFSFARPIGFDTSWELDLWGKYRRNVESAQANLVAS